MKCINCKKDYANIKKYGFHIGNSESNQYGDTTHRMNTTPIEEYVCNSCIKVIRSRYLRKAITTFVFILISIALVFLFRELGHNVWKIILIVIASILGYVLLTHLFIYSKIQDAGDQIVILNYLHSNPKSFKSKFMTRNDFQQNNQLYNSILNFILPVDGVKSDYEYYLMKNAISKKYCPIGCGELEKKQNVMSCKKCGFNEVIQKEEVDEPQNEIENDALIHTNQENKVEYCPRGCGELKPWNGKNRCWTCGWPDK